MAKGKGKGSAFERDICRKLSLWWTQKEKEPRDDIFWRTAGSGARATTRSKKNKKTANSDGDIAALDPIGAPLLHIVTIECKRGYGTKTIADLFDSSKKAAVQEYEKWILQAEQSKCNADTLSWLLIVRRNGREALAIFPQKLMIEIENYQRALFTGAGLNCDHFTATLTLGSKTKKKNTQALIGMRFDDWLQLVDPQSIHNLDQPESNYSKRPN